MNPNINITIIGTGLLGTSLGLALKANGHTGTIYGVGRRQGTVDKAKAIGAMDIATVDLEAAVADSAVAVLATPLGSFADIFARIARCDNDNLIITDVGSTKQKPIEWAKQNLTNPDHYVPAHPMAGSDKSGPQAGDKNLFKNKPCILTPIDSTNENALKTVAKLWYSLGMNIVRMNSLEHDQKVASISHLPHLVAGLLVEVGQKNKALDIASTGFADATRLAEGDAKMWGDIVQANRQQIITVLREFTNSAASLLELMEKGEEQMIQSWLRKGKG